MTDFLDLVEASDADSVELLGEVVTYVRKDTTEIPDIYAIVELDVEIYDQGSGRVQSHANTGMLMLSDVGKAEKGDAIRVASGKEYKVLRRLTQDVTTVTVVIDNG